jgi:hypothetical protein
MLRLTMESASLIRTLVQAAQLPVGAGLRLVVDPVHRSLSMRVESRREEGDSEVTRDGAHVFLAPDVARRLGARTLQAEITSARSTFFLE